MKKFLTNRWYQIVKTRTGDVKIAFPCTSNTGKTCNCSVICRGPQQVSWGDLVREPRQELPSFSRSEWLKTDENKNSPDQ